MYNCNYSEYNYFLSVLTFDCLGSWNATVNGREYTYAALRSLDINGIEESYKCMVSKCSLEHPPHPPYMATYHILSVKTVLTRAWTLGGTKQTPI